MDAYPDRPEKVLTPENPSITFFTAQGDIRPVELIGIIVYDRRGKAYIHHLQRPRKRLARWFKLRFTKKGRTARDLLVKLKLRSL